MISNILAAFLFSYYFVNIAGIPNAVKKGFSMMPHQRIKPFDCVQCFSVWLAIAFYFLPIEVAQFFAVIFAAGFVGSKVQ